MLEQPGFYLRPREYRSHDAKHEIDDLHVFFCALTAQPINRGAQPRQRHRLLGQHFATSNFDQVRP